MAKISKEEFLKNIQNIINEGLTPETDFDYTAKYNIRKYIDELFDEGQNDAELMVYLDNYRRMLDSDPGNDYVYFEDFGKGLSAFSSGNKQVKDVIMQMNDMLRSNGAELRIRCLVDNIQDPSERETVLMAFNRYISNEDMNSRNILLDALYAMNGDHDIAEQIEEIVRNGMASPVTEINPYSKLDDIKNRIKNDEYQRKKEEITSQVMNYANSVFDRAEEDNRIAAMEEQMACKFESIVNNNGINLRESIKNIVSSDAKSNRKLMELLEQYASALNKGLYEEKLYEGFVKNISKYDYLVPVEKEIKRINETVKDNIYSITLTKISEDMSESSSYYIIPLIEEDLARFIKNPSEVNRVQLRNILCPFASNMYCNQMLETIEKDYDSIAKTIDEKVVSFKDRVKMIKEDAHVTSIYSPVQYIKENECVFNANGQFYVKKSNTLAKLSNEYIPQLSERFIALCQLVNSPQVTINEDNIVLCGSDKIATIFEGYVEINGNKETKETLRNLNEMAMKYDYDTNFFIMASCLYENFDNIAKINFGKHITLNNNDNVSLDLFRLGDNIFINTVNEDMNKATFYHNVNPLQCRNIINRHMGINVASLFEDLMPSQDKILMRLNETKSEYESSIEKYEKTIADLEDAKEKCVSDEGMSKINTALEDAKSKLEDVKNEYKEWQKKADKATGDDMGDGKTDDGADVKTEEDNNNPIDSDEVDDAKPELMTPMTDETTGEAQEDDVEEDPLITDGEFDSYIEGREMPMEEPEETAGAEQMDEVPGESAISDEDADAFQTVGDEAGEEIPEDEIPADINFTDDGTEGACPEGVCDDPYEDTFEIPAETGAIEDETPETVDVPDGYQISSVMFDQDIHTGKVFNTGTIQIVCPMVSAEGHIFRDTNAYQFYIDGNTHLPIISAEVPLALYNAMVSAIQSNEDFAKADLEAPVEYSNGDDMPKFKGVENKPYVKNGNGGLDDEEDEGNEFFNFEDEGDSLTITPKEDVIVNKPQQDTAMTGAGKEGDIFDYKDLFGDEEGEEGEKVSARDFFDFGEDGENAQEIPAKDPVNVYKNKKDDTEFEFPAENAGDDVIPEATPQEVGGDESLDALVQRKGTEITDDDPIFDEGASDEETDPEQKMKSEEQNTGMDDMETSEVFTDDNGDAGKTGDDGDFDFNFTDFEDEGNGTEAKETGHETTGGIDVDELLDDGEAEKKDPKKTDKKKVNENRKNIIGVSAGIKMNGKRFFLSEGTIKPSKKQVVHVNDKNVDGIDRVNETPMYEEYTETTDLDAISVMHSSAGKALDAMSLNANGVQVSDINDDNGMRYFAIYDNQDSGHDGTYVIYRIGNRIYYRPLSEFNEICLGITTEYMDGDKMTMRFDDPTQPMDYIDAADIDACKDLIDTLLQSFGVYRKNVVENEVVMKEPSIDSGHDRMKSKMYDDILHGDKNTRDFREQVEKECEQEDIPNPMVGQPQQESLRVLPNAHTITESKSRLDDYDIIYEPQDWVVIKKTGMKGQVNDVVNDFDGKLTMLTVLASDGHLYDLTPKDIEPDELYLENIPGRVVNSQRLYVPEMGKFDIDPKTRLTRRPRNEKPVTMTDLNKRTTPVYIVAEGVRVNENPYSALVEDVRDSKRTIRVINEQGEVQEYDLENTEFTEKPYAVIVNSEGKPVRSIKIDPLSYINAAEDELVDCECGGRSTRIPKKNIDVLS